MDRPSQRNHGISRTSDAWRANRALAMSRAMAITAKDVLEALSHGAGPRRVLVTLGYASWGEGQLESELAENSWLTVEADPQVIFDAPVKERYDRALGLLGLQAWMLSPEAGHA